MKKIAIARIILIMAGFILMWASTLVGLISQDSAVAASVSTTMQSNLTAEFSVFTLGTALLYFGTFYKNQRANLPKIR